MLFFIFFVVFYLSTQSDRPLLGFGCRPSPWNFGGNHLVFPPSCVFVIFVFCLCLYTLQTMEILWQKIDVMTSFECHDLKYFRPLIRSESCHTAKKLVALTMMKNTSQEHRRIFFLKSGNGSSIFPPRRYSGVLHSHSWPVFFSPSRAPWSSYPHCLHFATYRIGHRIQWMTHVQNAAPIVSRGSYINR